MKENQQERYLFSNPICKQTYQSLPKIYGGKVKQKSYSRLKLNASNAAITKHNCLFHVEQIQKKSPLSHKYINAKSKYLSLPKTQKCTKKNCLCSKPHQQDMKTLRKAHNGFSGKKKIKLRPLPMMIVKPDDFESEHKVAMKINTEPSMPSGLAMIVNSQRHLAILSQSNPRDSNIKQQSFINEILNEQQFDHTETKRKRTQQQVVIRSKTQQIAIGTDETPIIQTPHISFQESNISIVSAPPQRACACVEVQVNLDDAIQKRSEQDSYRINGETGVGTQTQTQSQAQTVNVNQSSVRQKADNTRFKKLSRARKSKYYASEDEDQGNDESDQVGNNKQQNLKNSRNSSSSLALSSVLVRGLNSKTTQFKKLTQKQQKQNLKQSRAKSTKSNGTFRIPAPEDYLSYLKSYRVLDKKNFNLKQLVKKPLFSIIQQEQGVYFGEYENQQKNGTGINVTQKLIFEGVYQSGEKIKGCQRNIDGVYKGYFVNGKRDGYGTFQWNNGEKFQGNWKNGVKSGFGIWRSPKGDTYEGQWSNNRQHGQGVFKHKNSTYKGQYQNFLKHGKGQQNFINGDKYIGDYKLGKPDGFGKYTWYEGGFYEGQFKNGIRSGYGKLTESNGSVYEGQFYQDYKHGQGKQVYKSGDYFEGAFAKGSPIKGMLYKKQGKPQYIDNS